MLTNRKAVSTFILIILILCSVVFGAFLSYMWSLANFYMVPEKTIAITEVDFPVDHADYFYVTIMNPSSSVAGANVTRIYFVAEGDEEIHNVTDTDPEELPMMIERGTSKTIKCIEDWGEFAGETVTVHVSAKDFSGAEKSVNTQYVYLEVKATFDPTISSKDFEVYVRNNYESAINLTLTELYINSASIENITWLSNGQNVTLPIGLTAGSPLSFKCFSDWEGLVNPKIRAETLEGYYAEVTTNVTANVILSITSIAFNETNPNEISVTVSNSYSSSNAVNITDIVLTYSNGTTYYVNGSLTNPSFAPHYELAVNESVTFNHCVWNWKNYRNQNITVTVYTKQGFEPISKTVLSPKSVIFKITDLNFNLTDTNHFLTKIANMPASLQGANITRIELNGYNTTFENQIVGIGEEKVINCTFNWTSFRGATAYIIAYTSDDLSALLSTTPPLVDLKISVNETIFGESNEGITYVNVTILNTVFSTRTVNITQIVFKIENITFTIEGTLTKPQLIPNGYTLNVNASVTIVCPWNWTLYYNKDLTITVYTEEGFSVSQTLKIPDATG